MDYNNRTILITGLVICSLFAMYLSYQDIALAIVSGLVGYLSKDVVSIDHSSVPVESTNSDEPVSVEPTISDESVSVESVDDSEDTA